MDKFRWAYIGSGNIAFATARQTTASNRHEIASVWSRRAEHAQRFSRLYGGVPCGSVEEAVTACGADGAYIATVNSAHYDNALECISRGIPVLLEKPFALNAAQAGALFDAAKRKGVYIAEAMWTWYSPLAHQVRERIESGIIGEPREVTINYAAPILRLRKLPRLIDPSLGGGALLDIGIYPLTYCYRLFGAPERINCEGKTENEVDVSERITMEYSSGLRCTITVSLKDYEPESARILGTHGSITIPRYHRGSKAIIRSSPYRIIIDGKTDYLTQFDRAAEDIREGRLHSDLVPPEATLGVMVLMDDCRRQMKVRYPGES